MTASDGRLGQGRDGREPLEEAQVDTASPPSTVVCCSMISDSQTR